MKHAIIFGLMLIILALPVMGAGLSFGDVLHDPSGFTNPTNIYDADTLTYAIASGTYASGAFNSYIGYLYNTTPSKNIINVTVKVTSTLAYNSGGYHYAYLQTYNGATWTDVYTLYTVGSGDLSESFDNVVELNTTNSKGLRVRFQIYDGTSSSYVHTTYVYNLQYTYSNPNNNTVSLYAYDDVTLQLINPEIITAQFQSDTAGFTKTLLSNGSLKFYNVTPENYTIMYTGTTDYIYPSTMIQEISQNQDYTINAYLTPNATLPGTSQLRMRIKNLQTYEDYPGIIVQMQKYYPSTNSWTTVQMGTSDDFGYVYFAVTELINQYKFIFKDANGNILKTSNPMYFSCDNNVCTRIMLLSPYGSSSNTQEVLLNYVSNLSQVPENGSIYWEMSDANNHLVNITIFRPSINTYLKLCSYEVTAGSGTATCNLTSISGNVRVDIFLDSEFYTSFFERITIKGFAENMDKEDGVFFAMAIFLTLVGIGLYSPIATIVTSVIGLFIISLLGLVSPITIGVTIIGAILGIAIGLKTKR